MKILYIFRSNIKNLEYYHEYKTFEEFELKCHDFYLMMGVEFLKQGHFDKVIVWRLNPDNKKPIEDIMFNINDKLFVQKWVNDFSEVLKHDKPTMTFWRGGFKEYDDITKNNSEFFSPNSLYLAAGKRILPEYGGKYDKILVEDERDKKDGYLSFYKTCNPYVFKPLGLRNKYDLCFIANFTQLRYKGQEFFIRNVSESDYLSNLNIVHVGNSPNIGKDLCKKYGVNNIEFKGPVDRSEINTLLNVSKFGIVCSNINDGCPRVSTEILCSGTPLLIKDTTRLLQYYKQFGVVEFNENNFEDRVKLAISNYKDYKKRLLKNISLLSMNDICCKNFEQWI